MRKRAFLILAAILANTVLCTGCWNYREIDNLSIVAGAAVDRAEQGKYKLTTEIVDLHESGTEPKIKSRKLVSYGDTLFDAVRNTMEITASRLYWGHVEIVVISQEVARDGIVDILDFLSRDAEPRLSMDLLISKEKTAGEILNLQSNTTEIRSFEINMMLDAQKSLSKILKVQVYEFINALSGQGISPSMPVIGATENEGRKTLELSGTAVFKKDKLVYLLDGDESKMLLFATNRIKGGLLVIKNASEDEKSNITLEILDSKTKIKPEYSNGKLSIRIDVKTKTALGEESKQARTYNEKVNMSLEKSASKILKASIEDTIKKVQQDVDVDIYGFGKAVREDLPALWEKIGSNWEEVFRNLDVKVNATVEIKDSGLLSKPIRIGD